MPQVMRSTKLSVVNPAYYECDLDGVGVSLRISLNALDRLVTSLPPISKQTAGGLLIGAVRQSPDVPATVEDYTMLDWDSGAGAPVPGPATTAQLDLLLGPWKVNTSSQKAVLGYYRTAARRYDEMPPEDLNFLERYFPSDDSYALLLVPGPRNGFDIQVWRHQAGSTRCTSLQFRSKEVVPDLLPVPSRPAEPAPIASLPAVQRPGPTATSPPVPAWRKGSVAAGVALALAAGLLLDRISFRSGRAGTSEEQQGLDLLVQRQGDTLELRWNRAATVLRDSLLATIIVTEGEARSRVVLEPDQIRSGRFLYFPSRPDVSFRLEVVNHEGQHTSESIQTLAARSPQALLAGMPPLPPVSSQRMPSGTAPSSARLDPPETQRSSAPAPQSAPPPRSFIPLPTRLSVVPNLPELPTDMAPVLASARIPNVPFSPAPLAVAFPGPAAVPESPPAPLPVPFSAVAPIVPVNPEPQAQTAKFRPPEPIHQVTPVVPPTLRSLIKQEILVAVRATVDAHGRVTDVRPANALTGIPALLVPTTLDAVRKWRFDPARRNQDAIPGEVVLQFRFHGR